MQRRLFLALAGSTALVSALPLSAQATPVDPRDVLHTWYRLVLELVRHTATQSPPVASRAYGYLSVAAYEAVATGDPAMQTLAGQLSDLTAVPPRAAGTHDEAIVLHAVMSEAVATYFANTGPTGQRAISAMTDKLGAKVTAGVPEDVAKRSAAHGRAVAQHIEAWSLTDGGADVQNMGFPMEWTLTEGPSHWVPTSKIVQQQAPLLPEWGKVRPFTMSSGGDCGLPPPPDYSEDPDSEFYKQAYEVYEIGKTVTPEQRAIALFWSDDPMLSPTPPGHWEAITLQVLKRDDVDLAQCVDAMMRVSVAVADGFIACWKSKFEFDLLRPVTYIKRVIDKKWEPLLTTPPFPEYPSGHSSQSGAAAGVLTAIFGEDFAFEDATHVDDGIAPRNFASFWAAAEEAGISRLYGGIHFRAAIEQGLVQGACVAGHVNALKTLG